jgi:nucleoside-diphosphate-sugar epimerase
LGALKPTRDFNFVDDTVRGMIAVHDSAASVGEVINLGSGFEISVQDTVTLIADVMGKDVAVECEEERVRPVGSEVERLWADNGKARRLLGWRPDLAGIDGLRRGLEITAGWFAEAANRARYRSGRYTV